MDAINPTPPAGSEIPVVVILEDRPDSPAPAVLRAVTAEFASRVEFYWLKTPLKFVEKLYELKESRLTPGLFIIDVMISQVASLDGIGVNNVWSFGGALTGINFVFHFLRTSDSEYRNVPVVFLSVLEKDDFYSRAEVDALMRDADSKGLGDGIRYIEKELADEAKLRKWKEEFRSIFTGLLPGANHQ